MLEVLGTLAIYLSLLMGLGDQCKPVQASANQYKPVQSALVVRNRHDHL